MKKINIIFLMVIICNLMLVTFASGIIIQGEEEIIGAIQNQLNEIREDIQKNMEPIKEGEEATESTQKQSNEIREESTTQDEVSGSVKHAEEDSSKAEQENKVISSRESGATKEIESVQTNIESSLAGKLQAWWRNSQGISMIGRFASRALGSIWPSYQNFTSLWTSSIEKVFNWGGLSILKGEWSKSLCSFITQGLLFDTNQSAVISYKTGFGLHIEGFKTIVNTFRGSRKYYYMLSFGVDPDSILESDETLVLSVYLKKENRTLYLDVDGDGNMDKTLEISEPKEYVIKPFYSSEDIPNFCIKIKNSYITLNPDIRVNLENNELCANITLVENFTTATVWKTEEQEESEEHEEEGECINC